MSVRSSDSPRRIVLQQSLRTHEAVAATRPHLRGVSHLLAACVTVPLAIVWIVSTPAPSRPWVGTFAVGVAAMFATSALLHVRAWSPAAHERLLRLDHTGIYLAIVGTGVAIGVLGLRGFASSVLVTAIVVGGALGILVEWLPFAPPRGFSNGMYLILGWMPVVVIPWLWLHAGGQAVGLLMAGGLFYTVGAAIVGTRRPDPLPRWFGYHELFHVLVILAVVAHAWMIYRLA